MRYQSFKFPKPDEPDVGRYELLLEPAATPFMLALAPNAVLLSMAPEVLPGILSGVTWSADDE